MRIGAARCSVASVLAAGLLVAGRASAQVEGGREFSWRDVRAGCTFLLASSNSAELLEEAQNAVRRFCLAPAGDITVLKEMGTLAPLVVAAFRGEPRVLRVPSARVRDSLDLTPEEWAKRTNLSFVSNLQRTQGLNALASSRARGLEDAALWGTAQYVTDRFQEDVGSFVAGQAIGHLCDGAAKMWLPNACPLLKAARETGIVTTTARLRRALDADISEAPARLALLWATDSNRLARSDVAVSAWLWIRLAIEARRHSSPLQALVATIPDSGSNPWTGLPRVRVARQIVMIALLARTIDRGGPIASDSLAISKDQLWWGIRAVLLSLGDPEAEGAWADLQGALWPSVNSLAESWSRIVGTASAWNELAARVDTSRQRIRAAPAESLPRLRATLVLATVEGTVNLIRATGIQIGTTWTETGGEAPTSVAPLVTAIAGGDRLEIVDQALTLATSPLKSMNDNDAIVEALTLASELAQAPSPAAMESLLRATTTRRGAYAIKRSQGTNGYVTVGATLGLFGGTEWQRTAGEGRRRQSGTVAPMLGLGVHAGWRIRDGTIGKAPMSIELIVDALDLGALASYRLDPPDSTSGVETTPHAGLTQVFAPSLSIAVGIGRAPLLIGWTIWGQSPELRTLREAPSERLTMNRQGFFVAYDLPLFHLF